MMVNKRSFEGCVVALSLLAGHAHAEGRDPVAAQALFDDARRLMASGQSAEACPKFAESQRLDPGIGTAFNLADCYEKTGRIASAWALFLEVVSQARASGEADREAAAKTRASRLEPRLPKLRIRVNAESRLPGLEITRDGVSVGQAQWDSVVPVDPGPHEVIAKAPGRQTYSRTVKAEESVVLDFELPVLAVGTEPEAKPAAAGTVAHEDVEKKHAGSGPSGWVYGLGAVGIVGLGVGTTFAFMAMSDNKSSKEHCNTAVQPNQCDPEGLDARDSALKKGNVATAAFAIGGASLAGALVVWLVGGSGSTKKAGVTAGANVSSNGAELHLAGRF
jgi:hypothetical protein